MSSIEQFQLNVKQKLTWEFWGWASAAEKLRRHKMGRERTRIILLVEVWRVLGETGALLFGSRWSSAVRSGGGNPRPGASPGGMVLWLDHRIGIAGVIKLEEGIEVKMGDGHLSVSLHVFICTIPLPLHFWKSDTLVLIPLFQRIFYCGLKLNPDPGSHPPTWKSS